MPESEVVYLNNANTPKSMRRWFQKYLTWGLLIDLTIMATIDLFSLSLNFGFVIHRSLGFFCGHPSISHRYQKDTINATMFSVFLVFAPAVLIPLVEKLRHDGGVSPRKMWLWYVGYLKCLSSTMVVHHLLKATVGVLRPHFLHTCAPDAAQNCTIGEYVTEYKCLNSGGFTKQIVADSFLSFPSGHAGHSTMIFLFFAAFLHKRFEPLRLGEFMKPIIISLVCTAPIIVGISRVQDRRHHFSDVLVGSLIGMALVVYAIIFHCDTFNVSTQDRNESNSRINLPLSMSTETKYVKTGQTDDNICV